MRVCTFLIALTALFASAPAYGTGITVPGTKWCGPGNTAANYEDLGTEVDIDICCRAHDHCEDKILSNEKLNGLNNDGVFPIFSCSCESAFRECLVALHSMESAALGRIYFRSTNVCFDYNHPIEACEQHQWDLFQSRCISYKLDEAQPARWQFYDLPYYTHMDEDS
ncbi:CG30503 [Drosophila busckii]|uniref:Phospholipase A2 n=1 Tax=Drosophila busckii TaxID=30019 RepID=A0A0M4ED65_DROBS|nr:phospholipase A2 large subunit [Drosophila busckii]ALC40851.1 CG30503 [Drosophila busckii]